jgi:hypothetical protein
MQTLPLLNDIGRTYFLTVYAGNAGKFISDFSSAWRRLPENVKNNILDYWSKSTYVLFEISNFSNTYGTSLAKTGTCGTTLKFNSDDFDIMPPEAAQYTIAHELAHVYQFSAKLVTGKGYDYEGIANKLAEEWGFDHAVQRAWRLEQQNKSS